MKIIDKNTNEIYMYRKEMQGISFGKDWLDRFNEGDIIHVVENSGRTTHYIVKFKKVLDFLV